MSGGPAKPTRGGPAKPTRGGPAKPRTGADGTPAGQVSGQGPGPDLKPDEAAGPSKDVAAGRPTLAGTWSVSAGGKSPLDQAHPVTGQFPTGTRIPPELLAGLPFAGLDAELPLLLLPIRIETRYRLDAEPPELRIRVFPDQVHIDADTPSPGVVELELTRRFWTEWHTARGDAGQQAAWRAFVRRVGSRRAGYLARLARPTSKRGKLAFPAVEAGGGRTGARAALLPRQWVAVGYSTTAQIFLVAGREIPRNLRTSPDPAVTPWEVPDSGVVVDEGLAWMFDYGRAVEVGMGVTVPLTGDAAAALSKVATLVVVGVDGELDPVAASAEVDRLLDVHARTGGLAFVPQGTPTNNTESVPSGWTREDRELDDLAARELDPVAAVEGDNAGRLATALGIADPTTLRRAAFGTDPERGRSRAMIRVTFEAVLGTFLRQLLKVGATNGVTLATTSAVREWCVRHVTGGAAYPCLRIGPQPYGVLPVRRSTALDPDAATTGTGDHVQSVVSLLIDEWRRSAGGLAVLDPNRTDVAGAGEQETAIATVLATQPHPARLFVRRLDEYASLVAEGAGGFSTQGAYNLFVRDALDPGTNPNLAPPYTDVAMAFMVLGTDAFVQTIDDQIALWEAVYAEMPRQIGTRYADDPNLAELLLDAFGYIGAVLDMLRGYEQRQRPTRWLDLAAYEGVLGEPNTALVEGVLHSTSSEWGEDGIVQAPGAAAGATAADYLADLRERFEARGGTLPASTLHLDPEPLLYQLLDRTLHLVPDHPAEEDLVADALDELRVREPEELEWLLRETIGLGAHRLDAWATSLATDRLKRIRDARPAGIHVGAFGWVTDLEPRDPPALSAGFVHAPSMAHAATAAVLRAGWHAHGTDDPLSPVAVDLTSSRVRTAAWLLDGVRGNQDLGDLLGYRFERSLHDLGADQFIRDVRRQVLEATDRPNVAPDQPVDGVELLDLVRDGKLPGLDPEVLPALEELEGAFDAVTDAGLFEAVHQLVTGNLERATAMLDALATGTRTPPELRAPRTPRGGTSVEHRVVILLDPGAPAPGRGWKTGLRDRVAPALEAWVASLLPSAESVGFAATPASPDGAAASPLTLGDLGVSALDALWLMGDDPQAVSASVRTLCAGRLGIAGLAAHVDPDDAGDAPVSLTEFAVLAIELRRAIDSLREADARDLRPAGTPGEADRDDDAVLDAAESLILEFDSKVDRLDDAIQAEAKNDVALIVDWMARLGLSVGAAPTDLVSAAAVHDLAARRLVNVGHAGRDVSDRRRRVERQLAAAFGGRIPLLGSFPFAAAEGGSVVAFSEGLASADEVDAWLDAVGRVRPDLARLTTAGMLSELLSADGGLRGRAGQSPIVGDERWAATTAPATDAGGRLSVAALVGPNGPPAPGARVCGLVVDRWSERVPRQDQVTGVAFQFDAPSNRPPQAWLLAVTPDGEPWSLQLVLDTLLETLEWATLRAVGPEDLQDYGRAIPTVFVPGDLRTWPAGALT
jgi:hypothetical protein